MTAARSTSMVAAAALLFTFDAALAARQVIQHQKLAKLGHEILATLPMHVYREDCGRVRPIAMLSQGAKGKEAGHAPGAGMDPSSITPFAKVLKDGFFEVECVADYMFVHGDKFGDNKFSYELGEVSNVSIVHYSSTVPSADQQPMTRETCFAFCRTVPEMLFFGIKNGRECYCAPYYKAMADDSSSCDAVCEGDPTTMCGGKSKSSMFSMHQCTDSATELSETAGKMEGVSAGVAKLSANLSSASSGMQTSATAQQQSFGNVGDVAASDLMQTAKAFAGELEAAVTTAGKITTEMTALKGKESGLAGADFTDFAKAQEAEALVRQMEKATADGEAKTEAMQLLSEKALPAASLPSGAAEQYYPVMYFVDKKQAAMPSTCAGDAAASPMLATVDECAASCDATPGSCVGFSYFPHADGDLCFLFSKLTSATYYTGCGGSGTSFLQRAGAPANATQCMAKLQYYSGTTLAPDGSGKCKQCLKKVDEAKRCFQ